MPKDACYRKVKARYKVFPSAYASGAIAKCRKVGAKNWGNKAQKKAKGGLVKRSIQTARLTSIVLQGCTDEASLVLAQSLHKCYRHLEL